jgi:hypothetical protein
MTWTMKAHDTRPAYVAVLKDQVGTPDEGPLDLTDATEVRFKMRRASQPDTTGPAVDQPMDIVDAVNGIVSYTWQIGDTDGAGDYNIEFEITWIDGGVETVPNGPTDDHPDGYLNLTIYDDLDAG